MGAVTYGDVLRGAARPDELVPFGGELAHKGFALALGLELLVGALAGEGFGAVLVVARPEADPVPALRERAAGLRLPGDSSTSAATLSHDGKVWIALGAVYVLWGSTYLGIELAGETIPPLFAVGWRFVVAGHAHGRLGRVAARRSRRCGSRGGSSARPRSSAVLLPGPTRCSSSPSATCRSASRRS